MKKRYVLLIFNMNTKPMTRILPLGALALLLFFSFASLAQNMVINGNFESFSTCPTGTSQVGNCNNWFQWGPGTSDFFSSCAPFSSGASVPGNFVGNRTSASGACYMGCYVYEKSSRDYREYIRGYFNALQPGVLYEVSMSVARSGRTTFATDNLGMLFFVNGAANVNTYLIPTPPQVFFKSYGVITDTVNWTRLKGLFRADSAYTGIVIGGFYDTASIKKQVMTSNYSGSGGNAYYYFDSVVVKAATGPGIWISQADSIQCLNDTLTVKYDAMGMNFGNKMYLQLSDASGSFVTPAVIDSVATLTGGTLKTVLPASVTAGSGYRIRMVSSAPVTASYNEIEIRFKNPPGKPFAFANSLTLCGGGTLSLLVTGVANGGSVSWTGPAGYMANGASPSRANMSAATAGDYVVHVTVDGCTAKDTVTIAVNDVAKPLASANTPVCVGGDINLSATASTPGATYDWGGPVAYWAGTQNATRQGAQIIHKGKYWVKAMLNGCTSETDTVLVDVVPGPEVLVYPNPGDTICEHWDVTFVAVPKNAGTNPQYEWYKNQTFTGGTTPTYTASKVMTGDTFYVRMTSGTTCNTPIRSKPIRMTTIPTHTPPTIYITATPGTHVWPYVEVTFEAHTGNAGPHPGYQWLRNGANIADAQDSILKMTNLKAGDSIHCVVTSNHLCALPRMVESDTLAMNVDLEITKAVKTNNALRIYPNPNKGNFTIEAQTAAMLVITNVQGQTVGEYPLAKGANIIQLPAGTSGVYFGRVGKEVVRIVME